MHRLFYWQYGWGSSVPAGSPRSRLLAAAMMGAGTMAYVVACDIKKQDRFLLEIENMRKSWDGPWPF